MTTLLIATLVFVASLVSYSANATEVTGSACRDCSLSEARKKAIQLAAPTIQCQLPAGQTEMTPGNHECFSQSKKYYVYSKSNARLHAFLLYHSNQNASSPSELQLKVDTFTPTTAIQKAVKTSIEWHDAMKAALQHLSSEFTRSVHAPTERLLNASTSSYIRGADSDSSCSGNPSYRALYDAFSPGFKGDLQLQLNQELTTLDLGHYGFFEKNRITESGVEAVFQGVSVNFSIDYATQSDHAKFTYGWLTPALANTDYEAPHIVFTLGVDRFGVFANLNEDLSKVDGTTIANLRNSPVSGDQSNGLSSCAAKALHMFFDSNMKSSPIYAGESGD